MDIHPELLPAIERNELPDKLGFGSTLSPVMCRLDYADGAWGKGQLRPYADISTVRM